MNTKNTTVLIVLDGWGYREATEHNAIYHADTPTWDRLWATCPKTLLATSGASVGLPEGQMGNSEVGHMTIGAGRVINQTIRRIDQAISRGSFYRNDAYTTAIDRAVVHDKAIHILGLVSSGGVHSHERHIEAIIDMAAKRGAKHVYLHAFLDGRDTPPRSAQESLAKIAAQYSRLRCGRIASIIGRYYAMDRDNRWERTQAAYDLLTQGQAPYRNDSAIDGLLAAYRRDESDEFVQATTIHAADESPITVTDGDSVIVMNFRADRARQLSGALTHDNFNHFKRQVYPKLGAFVTTTHYADDIDALCAFPPESIHNSFGELMEQHGKTQLRIAETEKYAHVTFFFSGGREASYMGEQRILVPSPKVATYDLKPEMSAQALTKQLIAAIASGQYDVIICNYANGDMVGHTGKFAAAVKAAEVLDHCLLQVTDTVLASGGNCLITADHGNCEQMRDETHQPHTQHTTGPVPLVYVGKQAIGLSTEPGTLADVAPTMLALMGIDPPGEMSGRSLMVPLHS